PDVFKSPVEKEKYYMTACTERARCILMESRFPEGPFSHPKLMTIGGEPVKEIDPSVLVDDDGKVYIALPNFYVGQLDPSDYSKIIPETYHSVRDSMPLDNEPFEGPSLKKRMGIYYYIYIQNKGKIETNGAVPVRMAYMTSKNPLGPYTYRGCILDTYDYPGSGNVHGSFAQFNGNWYLSYHMAVPDLQLTRNACLDKLEFNLDGTIREVLPTSSGAKGGFEVNETIQASGGVIFSGGRNDIRLRTRKEPTENPYVFHITGYPYTVYEKPEEWIGYRYLNFSKRIKNVCVSVKTEAAGAVLEIRKGACDGKLIAEFYLPDTNGSWQTIKNKASSTEDGTDTFFIIMKEKPGKGEVGVDHLIFTVD
ncbi:MAG TPA: family 43 glycosylhydrolase, partial [Clostridia bacterium]|nr:family 43 glycosylhydrolase [Clostridia bacterium]